MISPMPFGPTSQLQISRDAADRFALAQAVHDATEPAASPRWHRFRHAVALRLISTAQAIDAH